MPTTYKHRRKSPTSADWMLFNYALEEEMRMVLVAFLL